MICAFSNTIQSQQTYTFTNAGNVGSMGPSQAMINANYAFTSLSGAVTVSAGIQSWTIPVTGLYLIDVCGAGGGNATNLFKYGGLGARMQGQFNLLAGGTLQILVGQRGSDGDVRAAGGGASYVLYNGALLIAAGGGGGASSFTNGVNASTQTSGTSCSHNFITGGSLGGGGQACTTPVFSLPGTYNGSGGGGFNVGPLGNGVTGFNGGSGGQSFLNGGLGGASGPNNICWGGFGGGGGTAGGGLGGGCGGGGYSGGAGGQQENSCAMGPRSGGGGGGSFNSGASQTNTSGFQQGDGRVILTYLCGSISLNSTSNPICPGNSVTLSTNAVSNYSWNTGSTSSSIIVSPTVTTTYSVVGQTSLNCTSLALLTLSVTQLSLTISASSPSICLGNAITFTASNSGGTGIYSYTWSAGPQTDTYTTVQNTAGNYVYTVNSSDANNCLSTQTIAVDFVPNPTLSVSNVSICPLETGTLNASGASSYTWLPGNISGSSFTQSPVGSTQYTVVGSALSCTSSAMASIIVKATPNPIINNNSPVCENTNLIFSVTSATASIWAGPQSFVSSFLNNTITTANPNQTGVYNVTVTAANSCTASTNATLTIKPLPTLTISPISPSICANTTTVSLSSSGTATLFNWSPALGLSSTTAAIVNAGPAATQIYNLVGALNACTVSASATVNVVPPPALAITLSSTSLCAQAFNGSPNTITLMSSGANTYTLSTPNHFNNANPGGPVSPVSLSPPYLNTGPATATLLGSNGVCTLSLTTNFTVVPNPTVALNSFTPIICAGETFTYTTSGANSFTWSSSTPVSTVYSTGNVAVANPSINSVFTVFGSSLSCNSALQTTSLTVTPLPVFSIQPNPAITCLGTAINLAAIGNANTYSWMPSTGLNQTQGVNVSSNPSSQQNYTIIGTTNNCSNMAFATVSVSTLPNLQVSATQTALCIGTQININLQGASQFTWSPSSGINNPNSPNVLASPSVNTVYQIIGSNGVCSNTLSIPITVIAYPSLTVTAPYHEICLGSSVPIYASGAQNYAWLPTTGLSNNNGVSALASPNISTTYTIIGINSSGSVQCTQQISYQIIVIPIANAQVSNSVALCLGEKTTLNASGGNTYVWLPPEGLNKTNIPSVVGNPTISTTYTVDVSQNGFCNAQKSVFVQVNPNPSVNAGRDSSFNLNEPIFIQAIGTGSINWISGEEIECTSCAYTQVYPRKDNCYIALVTNEFNCKAQDEVCIKVTAEYAIYIPNSFTPNKDGLNEVFKVYGDNIIDLQMEIYNRWGELIFQGNDLNSGWDGSLQGKDCPIGIYTYKVIYKGPDRKQYSKTGSLSLLK